jgi:hypothetical protein
MKLIIFIFMLCSILNISAEEIQPFPQLKAFPKLPQLPKFEPIRVPEPIKPFNTMPSEVDRSKLLSVQSLNFDKSQLLGDWKAVQPFVVKYIGGDTTIEGILFTVLPDSSLEKEWTSEGVMYESTTKDGARRFASSFNYKMLNNMMLLIITFSANDIRNGVVIPFEILQLRLDNNKPKQLKLKNSGNIIELNKQD